MLQQTVTRKSVHRAELEEVRSRWRQGDAYAVATLVPSDDGDQVYGLLLPEGDDVLSPSSVADVIGNDMESVQVLGRLDDRPEATAEEGYKERWRRFLAGMNLYQFCRWFRYWTTSEDAIDARGDIVFGATAIPLEAWPEHGQFHLTDQSQRVELAIKAAQQLFQARPGAHHRRRHGRRRSRLGLGDHSGAHPHCPSCGCRKLGHRRRSFVCNSFRQSRGSRTKIPSIHPYAQLRIRMSRRIYTRAT